MVIFHLSKDFILCFGFLCLRLCFRLFLAMVEAYPDTLLVFDFLETLWITMDLDWLLNSYTSFKSYFSTLFYVWNSGVILVYILVD